MSRFSIASMPDWARGLTKAVAAGAVCGVLGFFVGQLAYQYFPGLEPDLSAVRWADIVAGFLAAIMLIACAATLIRSFDRAGLGRMLKLEGPAGDADVREVRLQAAVYGLSAIILPLPMILSAAGAPVALSLAGVAGLLVLHTALNFHVYRTVDELFRRIVVEAGAVTFWLGQGVLFLWAAAERLAAVPAITAWDIYAVLMGVYLVVSMIVTMRRGLAG
ncbi:hypothetical protein GCM10009422_29490 [Brevundimonas kwangchunensis]|uniref:DUF998 domain-containing protein n=1 Tax=Brevundimonas kwangchunensis TaxID=322163 RepID=A0ABP3SA71_9CAUL